MYEKLKLMNEQSLNLLEQGLILIEKYPDNEPLSGLELALRELLKSGGKRKNSRTKSLPRTISKQRN